MNEAGEPETFQLFCTRPKILDDMLVDSLDLTGGWQYFYPGGNAVDDQL